MTTSPDPRRDDPNAPLNAPLPHERRRLTADELIAMFVAFLSIGGIFAWSLTRNTGPMFNFGSLSNSGTASNPSASLFKLPSNGNGTIAGSAAASLNAANGNANANPNVNANGAVTVEPEQHSEPAPIANNNVSITPNAAPTVAAVPAPVLPNVAPAPSTSSPAPRSPSASSPTGFSDVPADFWASAYVAELARRKVLDGFPNGTFQPNKPITRAEFAGIVSKAFDKPKIRQAMTFKDLDQNYWGRGAIDEAVQTGFLNGYPNGVFQPDQEIPLLQLQSALATGLKLEPQGQPSQVLSRFEDANALPKWSQDRVAAAVESGIVTNYPDPKKLDPNRTATRADAAALIYQALVKEGRISPSGR